MTESERLKRENADLRRELDECKKELDRLRAIQPFRRGVVGERYVADLIGGTVTITNSRHDVVAPNRQRLEVKLGGLRTPVRGARTKQWAWRCAFGEDGKKIYDRLVLLGPKDMRFDQSEGLYVIFDIPYADAVDLLRNPKYLAVTTNRARIFSKTSAVLYERYLTTEAEMKRRYEAHASSK